MSLFTIVSYPVVRLHVPVYWPGSDASGDIARQSQKFMCAIVSACMCKYACEFGWMSVCGKGAWQKHWWWHIFTSCSDGSVSSDRVSAGTKPLQSGLHEVSTRLRFRYCPSVRSRACVFVRSGCLCPLPSGLLSVTHVLPIQVTNALGMGGGGSLFTVATQISTSNPPARVFTRAQLAANGPIDLDPPSAPQLLTGRYDADILVFQIVIFTLSSLFRGS